MSSQRPPKPGAEVDAWCTKCRMDLLHRIIATDAGRIVRVECRTCGGHHNYHRPKSAKAPQRAPRRAADEAERERTAAWRRAVLGKPIGDFRAYRTGATYGTGDLIRHTRFGDGYVVRVIDRQKVEVMFSDGSRTLAQAMDP